MSNRTVLFLFQQVKCGRNKSQYQRAQYACQHYETHFITRRGICSEFEDDAATVHTAGETTFMRFVLPIWMIYTALKIVRSHDVAYTHTDYSPQALLAGYCLHLAGLPWVADIFDSPHFGIDLEGMPQSPGRVIARIYNNGLLAITRRTLKHANLVVIALAPGILSSYDINPDRDNVLYTTNGTDVDYTSRQIVQWDDHTTDDLVTLAYIGPIREQRGLQQVLDAISQLDRDDIELRLVGPLRQQNDDWLSNIRNQRHDVTVLGRVPHPDALKEISNADICLCPLTDSIENYQYSYPVKVFEYMAAGKPIIATELDGVSQIVTDQESAILVPPDNSDEWATAIEDLADTPTRRELLGETAREEVKQYDWGRINDKIWEAIEVEI